MEKGGEGKYDLLGFVFVFIVRVVNCYWWQILLKLLFGCDDVFDLIGLINVCCFGVSLIVDVDFMNL